MSARVRVPGIVFGYFAERISKTEKENDSLNFSEHKQMQETVSKQDLKHFSKNDLLGFAGGVSINCSKRKAPAGRLNAHRIHV